MFNEGRSILSASVGKTSKTTARGSMEMELYRKSECLLQLSSVSRQIYIENVTKAGLSSDLESSERTILPGKFRTDHTAWKVPNGIRIQNIYLHFVGVI